MAELRKEAVYQVPLGDLRGDKMKKLFKSFFKMYPCKGAERLKLRHELEK
jgi:hypothetical protein